MKIGIALAVATSFLASQALAEWPANVKVVTAEKGKTVTASGKLEDGAPIEDLSWAANSAMACFPATQNSKFRGNHVFFATQLPPKSFLTVKVIPKDVNADLSIWGYQVGPSNFRMPPKIESAVACEAEHKWDRPKKGKTQDHTRTIEFNSIKNPYQVLIGVSGPEAAKAGEFTLEITLK
jgi:hypothetical protein